MKILKKIGIGLGLLLGGLLLIGLVIGIFLHESRPEGTLCNEADDLAYRMMESVDCAAWDSVEVISWNFAGRNHHMWDRNRHLDRIQFGEYDILIDLNSRWGIVKKNGQRIEGKKAEKLLEKAWASWANDSFWLNPVCKAFDEGTDRCLVDFGEEGMGVMVSYKSGGVTPGDSYLWILDENYQPKKWKMWVKIIPIGGVETTWEEWKTLYNGAKIASLHSMPFGDIKLAISDIQSGTADSIYKGADPFSELVKN